MGLPATSRLRIAWMLTGVAGLAALIVFRAWTPDGPPTCLMVLAAGVACPGCGMTRATARLAQGDLAASWRLHPLAVVFAAQAVIAWCWWGLVAWKRVRTPSPWWGIVPLTLDLVALAVTWLIRWSAGTLPR